MLMRISAAKMSKQKLLPDKKTRKVTINTNTEEKKVNQLPNSMSIQFLNCAFHIFQLELKLALKLFLIIVIWIGAWTPAAMVAILQLFGHGDHVSHGLSIAALLSIKTSSVINMFVYGLRLDNFTR